MADATIKAWRCDICGEAYTENSPYYTTYYSLDLKMRSGYDYDSLETNRPDVCYKCAARIDALISELEDGDTSGEM